MCMNWIRYGSIFESGYGSYQSDFSLMYLQRDWKDYLISIDRGIITYSPIILLGIISFKRFFLTNSKPFFLIASICLTLYLLTASWIGWKGGYCWGNRNLVPIVLLFAYLGPSSTGKFISENYFLTPFNHFFSDSNSCC